MQPTAKLTLFFGSSPPLQRKEDEVPLNSTFTFHELMLLAFARDFFHSNLNQKNDFYYFDSKSKQNDFSEWMVKSFTSKKFTSEELNVVNIVSSIWEKAKKRVETELKTSGDPEAIEDEKELQRIADGFEKQASLFGMTGKMFTVRQGTFLLSVVNHIGT